MKILAALLFVFSFSSFAQDRTETINVENGKFEVTVERKTAEMRKQTAVFRWNEKVRVTRNVCVATQTFYRTIYCRRNGRLYPCGRRAVTRCVRFETREYEEIRRHKYGVKIKYAKSARTGFGGLEQYLVKFSKDSLCGTVTAANENAEQRDIENSCRKTTIR